MKKQIYQKAPRILKNRKKLERGLNVKIINRGKEINIDGSPEEEYVAEKVLEAIELGFPFSAAMSLKEFGYTLEKLNIKDHTKRKDLRSVRARIIGKDGRTLKTLHTLTQCFFELKDNTVAIIGDPELVKNAHEAIISLIKGSKQSNIYSRLEKSQPKEIYDLGLKKDFDKRGKFK
ncbi:MAG: KH domain-containing protein [Candidatus Pacearchaeota archaeon]